MIAVDDDQVQLGVELQIGQHVLGLRDHRRELVDGDLVRLAVRADALGLAAIGRDRRVLRTEHEQHDRADARARLHAPRARPHGVAQVRHELGIDLEVDELAGLVHVEKRRMVEQAVERGVLIGQQGRQARRPLSVPGNPHPPP